jgi:uncharacterized membrane protein
LSGRLVGVRVLLVGESWHSYGVHQKGFNAYYTGSYAEGHAPLSNALTSAGAVVTYVPNHHAATDVPRTVEGLRDTDVVILSDVGSDTLLLHPDTFAGGAVTGDPLAAIGARVAGGAGLLMIGGYLSFTGFLGEARYGMTALAGVLPVDLLPHDDRVERPDGVVPTGTAAADGHPILAGIDGPWPAFLGYNRLLAKPGSTVLLEAGTDPFLAVGSHGAGRVAAFASDCSAHWGPVAFTGWEQYGRFWVALVAWLAGDGDRDVP